CEIRFIHIHYNFTILYSVSSLIFRLFHNFSCFLNHKLVNLVYDINYNILNINFEDKRLVTMTSQNHSETDENRQTDIPRRTKKRRFKKGPFILLGIILLLIGLVFYITASYKSGLKVSTENGKDHQLHKFHSSTRNDGKVNVLVLGEDRKVDNSQPRTDSIMVVQYDYL